jgi:nucleolar protein 56
MKAFAAKHPIGLFVFSEAKELLHYRLSSKSPSKAVEEFLAEPQLPGYELVENDIAWHLLRKNVRDYAISLGFCQNDTELNEFLSAFATILAKRAMKGSVGRDKLLMQASNALENLNYSVSSCLERLKEWYSLHYPELNISQKELLEKFISYGKRENFPGFRESTGVSLEEKDESVLKEYASMLMTMVQAQHEMEKYIKETVKEIAPNFSSLIDPMLAAKFMALSGGLEKLARSPASSIQLLGAEKALFRHLKKQHKSPKYGILFQDARIQNALPEKKGKVARTISSKLMIAARIDFYSGRFEEKLKKDLEKELKAI